MKKALLIFLILTITATALLFSACTDIGEDTYLSAIEDGTLANNEQTINSDNEGTTDTNGSLNLGNDIVNIEKDDKAEEEKEEVESFVRLDILLQATVGGLNVRSAPSASAKSIGCLDKGDYVSFLEENNGWYTTFYKEKKGYVSAKYCDVIEIPLGSEKTENIIDEGKKLLGYPYIWGSERYHWGNGKLNKAFVPGRYDCSALMQYIFYKGGNDLLGLTTREQVIQGKKINKSNIERGDLLFFTNSSRKNLTGIERVGHVGLYLGNNLMLHTASDYACIEEISNARWSYYISASRF